MDMARRVLLTAASLADQPDFAIGDTQVCPATRRVRGPGGTAKLEPRVMQVLIALAEADGAVVTRETLLDRCWGGVFVGDDSLNRAIAGVRRVAAGVGAGGFSIETVPRTGSQLIFEAGRNPAEDSLPGTASDTGRTLAPRRLVLAGGLAAGSLATLGLWFRNPGTGSDVSLLIEESRVAMRSGTPEGRKKAVTLLERAVETAPDNADAWAALALTRARIDEHSVDQSQYSIAQIDEEAHRALQIDPDNADARAALALAIPYYGDWLAAERRFDGILSEHPGHTITSDARSFLFGAVGRMEESARSRLAMARDAAPDPELQFRDIYALWFLGRIGEADRVASRAMEMWPGHAGIWFARLWLLAGTARFDRALQQINSTQGRPSLPPPMLATLGAAMAAVSNGAQSDAGPVVGQVMAGVGQSVAAVVNAMMLLNLLGATDEAFDLARAYYLEQGPILAAMSWRPGQPVVPDQRRRKTNMLFTPIAAGMHRDDRFMPLMEQMGLTGYWRQRGVVPDFLKRARA